VHATFHAKRIDDFAWRGWINHVDVAGSPFYTSGTFWAGAGAVIGVVSLVALGWVTWRAANPKRRLWYSMSAVTPLVTRGTGLSRELKITYGGHQLVSPHTANIQLVSRGRLDIPRSAFDGEQPLQLDVGAPIVEMLNVTTSPDRPTPPLNIDHRKLFIGPCLIGHREAIEISLLVDGDPKLSRLPQSLENVDIRRGDPDQARQTVYRLLSLAVSVGAAIVAGVLGVLVATSIH
jgi:hypothetical protein